MKKKIPWFNILFILLLLIVIGLLTYNIFLFQNKNGKNEKKETKTELKEEKKEEEEKGTPLDSTDNLVTALINPFLVVNNYFQNNYFGYLYNGQKFEVSTLADDVKIMIAINTLNDNWDDRGVTDTISLTSNQVDQAMKKLFGNISYNHTSLKGQGCAYSNFAYNPSTQTYSQSGTGCGGTALPFYESKIVSATKYNDRIEITMLAGYFEYNTSSDTEPILELYNNNSEKVKIASNITEDVANPDPTQYFEYTYYKALDTYKDQLYKYKFTFNLEDGEYHFKKIERQK